LEILTCSASSYFVEEFAYCSVVQLSKLPAAVAASAVGKVQRNLVMLARKKPSFVTEAASVSCWHLVEVQTEWFLADFSSRIAADCRLPL